MTFFLQNKKIHIHNIFIRNTGVWCILYNTLLHYKCVNLNYSFLYEINISITHKIKII